MVTADELLAVSMNYHTEHKILIEKRRIVIECQDALDLAKREEFEQQLKEREAERKYCQASIMDLYTKIK